MPAYDRPDQLPEVLQQVTVRVQRTTGATILAPTRVLDLERRSEGEVVVVACPAAVDPSEHHFEAELAWTHPLGRVSRPVSTHPGRRPYGAVWVLVPDGPPRRVQERRHFRARMSLPLRVAWDAEEAEAITVDLSEGGLLALLRGEPPAVGSAIATTLLLDGAELGGRGTVVRHVRCPGGTAVGVRFCEPHAHADRLRRAAFDAERRRVREVRAAR